MEVAEMDTEGAELREMGREADRAEDRPIPETAERVEKPETRAPGEAKPPDVQPPATGEPEIKPSSSDLASDIKKQQRDEKGQFAERTAQKAEQKQPETEYSRAQKEEVRKERSWQALEEQKAEFRAQQAQWQEQARMAQLQAVRARNQPILKDGLGVRDYYEGFQRFKQMGDHENALAAMEVCLELQNAEQQRSAQQEQVNAEYVWRTDMEVAARQLPDIAKQGSPIAQRLEMLIEQNPWLYYIPHGFLRAAEVADILVKSDTMSELQEENEKLRAELERRNAGSQPLGRGGARGAGGRSGEKAFDDMTLDEQGEYLERATREADQR